MVFVVVLLVRVSCLVNGVLEVCLPETGVFLVDGTAAVVLLSERSAALGYVPLDPLSVMASVVFFGGESVVADQVYPAPETCWRYQQPPPQCLLYYF